MIYRNFDQAGLDAQYNLRARHPDFQRHFDDWAERSRSAAGTPGAALDLPYGLSPAETLDVFPAREPSAPVLVFIHGGYWRSLDKREHRFLAPAWVQAGVTFVNVNYALAPAVTLDEIVRQCRAAVAWTFRSIAGYGGDPRRIHVAGHSAGGHLTAMLLSTRWAETEGLPADPIRSGCAISGLFDLEPVRLAFLNADLRLTPESARRNSPLYLLPPNGAPLLAAVGADETAEFLRQSADYAAAWRAGGHPCRQLVPPGRHHFSILDELADPSGAIFLALREQMQAPGAGGRAG